ncbi:transcriptional regulator, SARP family [Catenulispora acidiphila DSM 44928]|uniref:Transcriptional regulator, SARP family n=1 Tax=Catenulispora acidiphila (strain DSM 44928 / JCM 14897 / NBRC 102108 / NRRL B-24433 / ID139908) TaxID=479433 RepID=C7QBX1_CATAD|nr:transcriptional regulator, SARP family [Catenulispora acidiphila DSM 44928]
MVISFDPDDVGSAPSSRRDGGDGAFDGQSTFVLLGPLSIAAQGTIAPLQPSRPATLLATLLLHPNSVVSIGALVRAVWDEEPPVSAKAALHTCVQRLRRLFAKYGVPGGEIEAVSGGYRIAAQAETLDLMRFRGLAARAHAAADPQAELALLREALALWRGPALSNVRSQVLHREEVPALDEERLSVVERVFDLEIALDRRREVLPELFTATRAHPTHEHFWEQLIESLYRTGRRAEALGEYRRIKRYLREQLGVDPGAALQQLELMVLRGNGSVVERAARPETGAVPLRLLTEAQILDRLQSAGLVRKQARGYQMHELLYVLTRDAAVVDHGAPEPGALLSGKDDVD